MLRDVFKDMFTPTVNQDEYVKLFQNEYRKEYNHLRKMGTPISRKLVKNFLAAQEL